MFADFWCFCGSNSMVLGRAICPQKYHLIDAYIHGPVYNKHEAKYLSCFHFTSLYEMSKFRYFFPPTFQPLTIICIWKRIRMSQLVYWKSHCDLFFVGKIPNQNAKLHVVFITVKHYFFFAWPAWFCNEGRWPLDATVKNVLWKQCFTVHFTINFFQVLNNHSTSHLISVKRINMQILYLNHETDV